MAFHKVPAPANAKVKQVSKKEGGNESIILEQKTRVNVPSLKAKK